VLEERAKERERESKRETEKGILYVVVCVCLVRRKREGKWKNLTFISTAVCSSLKKLSLEESTEGSRIFSRALRLRRGTITFDFLITEHI
jgi:hypothetical protein